MKNIEYMLKINVVGTLDKEMEYFLVKQKDNDKCIIYNENKKRRSMRKHPQFIFKSYINHEDVDKVINWINSRYVALDEFDDLEKGLVNTVTQYLNLSGETITNITFIDSDSEYYNFRQKTEYYYTNDVRQKAIKDKTIKLSLTNDDNYNLKQADSGAMYGSYKVYLLDLKTKKVVTKIFTHKQFILNKGHEVAYLAYDDNNENAIAIIPMNYMKWANLRVRDNNSFYIPVNGKPHAVLYAKPVMTELA